MTVIEGGGRGDGEDGYWVEMPDGEVVAYKRARQYRDACINDLSLVIMEPRRVYALSDLLEWITLEDKRRGCEGGMSERSE